MNFIFKHLERLFSAKRFVVHCANAGYRLVLLACLVVSGPVIGANVEAKPLHFDCERVEAGFKTPLNVGGGLVLIEPDGGTVWCKSSAQVVGGFSPDGDAIEFDRAVKLITGKAPREVKGDERPQQRPQQRAANGHSTANQRKLIRIELHEALIILGGWAGGVAIACLLTWAWFSRAISNV